MSEEIRERWKESRFVVSLGDVKQALFDIGWLLKENERITALEAENTHLRAAIEAAPHAYNCELYMADQATACTCWKRDALPANIDNEQMSGNQEEVER